MKDYTKKITTYFIAILSSLIITSWFAYVVFFRPPKINRPILELSIFEIFPPPEAFKDYNYPKLLNLFEEYRSITLKYSSNFNEFISNEENKNKVSNLIKKLKEENHLFNKYYRNLRFNRKLQIPKKKRRSLLYHSAVIESSIKELQEISKLINSKHLVKS